MRSALQRLFIEPDDADRRNAFDGDQMVSKHRDGWSDSVGMMPLARHERNPRLAGRPYVAPENWADAPRQRFPVMRLVENHEAPMTDAARPDVIDLALEVRAQHGPDVI